MGIGRWLGFGSSYYGIATNVLWGATGFGMPGTWYGLAYDGSVVGTATYAAGALDWTREYDDLRTSWNLVFCDPSYYAGSTYYGDHPSSYGAEGSMPCALKTSYERWTFTSVADENVYVTVDTLDAGTAFDPAIWLTGDTACALALAPAHDGLSCAYATSGDCAAYKFFATKGEQYSVLVYNEGTCAGATADYEILVDSSGDPSLTLEADDATAYIGWHVKITGAATVP